jgi:hypothetical protein
LIRQARSQLAALACVANPKAPRPATVTAKLARMIMLDIRFPR